MLIIFVLVLAVVSTATAQLRIGAKAGITAGKLHFNSDMLKSSNRTGFSAGVLVDLKIPLLGLRADASLMFSRHNDNFQSAEKNLVRNYIDIPVHLRYGFHIPAVGHVVEPYVMLGPVFSFLCHETRDPDWDNRASTTALELGGGVELLSRIQLSVAYTFALNRTSTRLLTSSTSTASASSTSARDRYWSLSAAVLF